MLAFVVGIGAMGALFNMSWRALRVWHMYEQAKNVKSAEEFAEVVPKPPQVGTLRIIYDTLPPFKGVFASGTTLAEHMLLNWVAIAEGAIYFPRDIYRELCMRYIVSKYQKALRQIIQQPHERPMDLIIGYNGYRLVERPA